jgi:succinyl-CoA:acetate CoA-transferase
MSQTTIRGTVSERLNGDLPKRTPEAAAQLIAPDATLAVSGFGSVGYPKAVPLALAESDRDLSLAVVSGGSVGGEIDTKLIEQDAIERRFPFQAQSESRAAINDGSIAFHDRHIASLGDEVCYGPLADPDIALIEAVAVGDDWLIPSTSIGHTPAYVAAADRVIVEVNEAQPLGLQQLHDVYRQAAPPQRESLPLASPDDRIGSCRVEFDPAKLAGVVTVDRPDTPYSFRTPSDVERDISENLGAFLEEEVRRNPIYTEDVHVQFGVGSIGNAMIEVIQSEAFSDRTVHYFGEVFQDGLLDLLDQGVIASASATSLALSEDGQRRLFEDLDRYASDIVVRPGDVSNHADVIDRFGVIGINSALNVDIYGNANSTHIGGTDIVHGIGGSSDFLRHCPVGIVALPSVTNGGTSRICPMVRHVDHTEHDIDVVVTEHDVADLRGAAPRERADKLIQCAHPDVRGGLRAYVERATTGGGHIPHDLETAFGWYETDGDDQ